MKRKIAKIMTAFTIMIAILLLPACGGGNDSVHVKASGVRTGQLKAVYTITGALVPERAADISAPFLGKVSASTS